jgi:hypothetical protein
VKMWAMRKTKSNNPVEAKRTLSGDTRDDPCAGAIIGQTSQPERQKK